MLFYNTQTFIVATSILLYDMHNQHFAFGTSCIWFWCTAVNQFANNSVLSIRTYTAVIYNTRITYLQQLTTYVLQTFTTAKDTE